MADPVSIAVMTGVSMGTTALGGIMKGKGERDAANASAAAMDYKAGMMMYQAGVSQVNKKIAEENADYALHVGEVTAQQSGLKTRAALGTTRAIQGASGIDVNTGSFADVRESMQDIGEYEQTLIRSDAARRAYGYEVEAVGHEAQAELHKMGAEGERRGAVSTRRAGKTSQFATLLGTATSVSDKWIGAKTKGVF